RRDHLHVGHDRAAEGRAVLQSAARVHHADRCRRPLGRRRALVQRDLVRPSGLHDEAPGCAPARWDELHHGTMASASRTRVTRAGTHDDGRRRPHTTRADVARPRVRSLRPVVGAAPRTGGLVRTGDLGCVDDRGRSRLVGRSKEMYVRGGYNVYPVEVEQVLSTHPDVAAIAIVPRPDDVMGEIGVAVLVARDPHRIPTLAVLRDFAAPHIAAYKLPEGVHVVDALPLTAGEKVDRRALAETIAA